MRKIFCSMLTAVCLTGCAVLSELAQDPQFMSQLNQISSQMDVRANAHIAAQQQRDRVAAEQAAIYQQRLQLAHAANSAEEARRSLWQAQQQKAATQQQTNQAAQTRQHQQSQQRQQPANPASRPAPTVRSEVTSDITQGGTSGRVWYVNVYVRNTGNAVIDCDIWLRGAFWNDRAGPGMGSDQSLSSITTENRTVIGLKPGERRRAMSLSHHVMGSKYTHGGNCRTSFTTRR